MENSPLERALWTDQERQALRASKKMNTTEVNYNRLRSLLSEYIEGFNNCACCPIYHVCYLEGSSETVKDNGLCEEMIVYEYLQKPDEEDQPCKCLLLDSWLATSCIPHSFSGWKYMTSIFQSCWRLSCFFLSRLFSFGRN